MTTKLELIQSAQGRIGDEPIAALTDPGADTLSLIYDRVRDDLISRYAWTWATPLERLTRLVAVPEAHWSYYYQLPSGMIGAPRAVYDRSDCRIPTTSYEMLENRLATNAEEVWVRYTKRADIAVWPGYFVELMDTALQSQFALTIREDKSLYATLREVAFGSESLMGNGGLFQQAKNRDVQSKPSPVIAPGSNPLIAARS